jgi:hypothetical protein
MTLKEYREKRQSGRCPEPRGRRRSRSRRQPRFVIQHHAACTDHYDFRLETRRPARSSENLVKHTFRKPLRHGKWLILPTDVPVLLVNSGMTGHRYADRRTLRGVSFRTALRGRRVALKPTLMDQSAPPGWATCSPMRSSGKRGCRRQRP